MIPQARPKHETATEGLALGEPGNKVTEAGCVYKLKDTTNSKEEHRKTQKHQTKIHEMHRGPQWLAQTSLGTRLPNTCLKFMSCNNN